MKKINIVQNIEIAPGIYSLTFRKFFDFIPGQVVKITVNDSIAPRMYSIASGTSDDNIQLIYNIRPEGELTNKLKGLKAGDEISVSLPFGQFICPEGKVWWIATGTGIAPFYSMLKSGRNIHVTLIHGVKRPESLLFRNEIFQILNKNYIPCCTGEKLEGSYYGRVTEYLRQTELLPDAGYYLCGSAEMVVDVRDLLIEKGVPYGNIFCEIYF